MFDLESSKKAMAQFATDDERAALFLEMTSSLFEVSKSLSESETKNINLEAKLKVAVEALEAVDKHVGHFHTWEASTVRKALKELGEEVCVF